MEVFEVTGSRLTGAAAEGSLSVSTYKIDTEVALQGYSNFGDMLRRKLPQYGGGIGTINESFGNGGSGEATISLRNLPGSRTLFLVNGRRTGADLNLIPTTAIESIEVLNDGASAVYGSEAIAGVVNVKLKKNFQGLLMTGRYANTWDTDISERRFGLVAGAGSNNLRMTVSLEYSKANDQLSPDRPVSTPTRDMVSGTSNPGLFTPRFTAADNPAGQVRVPLQWFVNPAATKGLVPGTALPAAFNPVASVLAPTTATTAARNALRNAEEARLNALMGSNSPVLYGRNYVYSSLGDLNPGFPYGYYTPSYRSHERNLFTGNGEYDFLGEELTGFVEIIYSTHRSKNALAPSPLGGKVLPSTNYWFATLFPSVAATGRAFTYGYRPTELGPRITTNDFEQRRFITGLRGKLKGNWKWEIAYTDDSNELDQVQAGGVRASVYDAALAGRTAATAFNPFGATPLFATSSPVNPDEMIQSFAGSATARYIYDTKATDATVSGTIFDLPAGAISVAAGAEYRQEIDRDEPSLALVNMEIFPFNAEPAFTGKRKIKSMYAEIGIPVFRNLSVTAAGRMEDYDDVGETGLKPRINFRWQPTGEELTIRGSWAQGFVAPGLLDLKPGDRGQSYEEVLNPVTGIRTQPEEGVFYVGNPALKPAESDSYLVGAVYSPKAVRGLTFGANYYRIEEEAIPFESAQYIVTQWAAAGGPDNRNNPFGPTAAPSGQNPTGAQVVALPGGELDVIRSVGPVNSGERFTDGFDLFANYDFRTNLGDFRLGASWTRVMNFEQEDFPGAGTIDYLGKYWGGGAALGNYGFPKWKGSTTIDWKRSHYTASVGYNFTSGYLEDENDNWKVEPYQTFDVRFGMQVPWIKAQLMVGVNNVTDEDPPFVVTSFENGHDRAVADIRGRMYFIELSRKF